MKEKLVEKWPWFRIVVSTTLSPGGALQRRLTADTTICLHMLDHKLVAKCRVDYPFMPAFMP